MTRVRQHRTLQLALPALLVFSAHLAAQSRTPIPEQPSFEVASIKRSGPIGDVIPGELSGGRWVAQHATVRLVLQWTQGLFSEQIVGGPAWVDTERFDITATTAGPVTRSQVAPMVKQLLADRFKLRTHVERRPIDVYVMTLARGPQDLGSGLRPSKANCEAIAAARERGETMPGATGQCGGVRLKMVDGVRQLRMTGHALRNIIPLTGAGAVLGRPVIDRTGLTGLFDIDLDYVPQSLAMAADTAAAPPGPPILAALQTQLGLKLERGTEALDVLVIDSIEMPSPA